MTDEIKADAANDPSLVVEGDLTDEAIETLARLLVADACDETQVNNESRKP